MYHAIVIYLKSQGFTCVAQDNETASLYRDDIDIMVRKDFDEEVYLHVSTPIYYAGYPVRTWGEALHMLNSHNI